jgi:hypothetical protein
MIVTLLLLKRYPRPKNVLKGWDGNINFWSRNRPAMTPNRKCTTPKSTTPPGPGWKHKRVSNAGDSQNRGHWMSPTRNIEFRRRVAACEFEKLRRTFGTEKRAWHEYSKLKANRGAVVLPGQYDDDDCPVCRVHSLLRKKTIKKSKINI